VTPVVSIKESQYNPLTEVQDIEFQIIYIHLGLPDVFETLIIDEGPGWLNELGS
jgi:hypothetical protein